MDLVLYNLDDISKAVLLGLEQNGRSTTLTQILILAGHVVSNDRQIELATSLESLGLIENVSYQLPLRIRAELSKAGHAVVKSIKKDAGVRVTPEQLVNTGAKSKARPRKSV